MDSWNDNTNPFPSHPAVINDQIYRTSSSLHPLDDLKKDVDDLKKREGWPRITDSTRVVILTYDATMPDSLSYLQKTILEIPRFSSPEDGTANRMSAGFEMMKRVMEIPLKMFWTGMFCITCIFVSEPRMMIIPLSSPPPPLHQTQHLSSCPPNSADHWENTLGC